MNFWGYLKNYVLPGRNFSSKKKFENVPSDPKTIMEKEIEAKKKEEPPLEKKTKETYDLNLNIEPVTIKVTDNPHLEPYP